VRRFEPLENRTLLTFIGMRDANTLDIDGTDGNDLIVIDVAPDPTKIRIAINADTPVDFPRYSSRINRNVEELVVFSVAGNDVIRINGPLDLITGVVVNGGPGDDLIINPSNRSTSVGEEGNDTIRSSGNDTVYLEGAGGKDVLTATGPGRAIVVGGSGNDMITTAAANDTIWGGPGSDTITAGAGDDVILGGRGNDSINAGDGNDYLFGQQGDDTLNGGNGADHLFGQDGNDLLSGDGDRDTLYGGSGTDLFRSTAGDLAHRPDYRSFEPLFTTLIANRAT
jgi:Ca2+-binding RTX toxin-like protein